MTAQSTVRRGASLADAAADDMNSDLRGAEMLDSNGAVIVELLEGVLTRFLVLPRSAVLPIALWLIATHCFRLFQALAYVSVVSPTPGCGKTRLQELASLLVSTPEPTSNTTEASLFRMIESYEESGIGPTLLFDEAETLRENSERSGNLRNILNAGNRADAVVNRCNKSGNGYTVEKFHVYCPKMISCIEMPPPTIASRSIVMLMQKKRKDQRVERFIKRKAQADCDALREVCGEWIKENQEEIGKVYDNLPDLEFLPDRDAEGWEPLFAILSVAAPHRIPELRRCAESLTRQKVADTQDDNLVLRLLADIRSVWPENQRTGAPEPRAATSALLERLRAIEESPWADDVPLSPRRLAKMLKGFVVVPKQMRFAATTGKGYEYSELSQVFSRYLAPLSETSETRLKNE